MNKTEDLTFYSQRAIWIATFLGGPLAAGYLIRENFKAMGKPEKGNKALIIGIVATIVLFVGIFMIPDSVIDKIPPMLIPLTYLGIVYVIVERTQGTVLNQHKENDNAFFSWWRATGIGVVCLLIITASVVGYTFYEMSNPAYEQYDAEMVQFSENEAETLVFYDHLDTQPTSVLLSELNNTVLPKWKENISIIERTNQLPDLPSELVKQNEYLLKYAELRVEAFELLKKAILEDTDQYSDQISQLHFRIDDQLRKLN